MSDKEAWIHSQVAPTTEALRAGNGCHVQEGNALNAYLDNELTAKEAATAITKPVLEEDNPPASLYRLMGLLCEALVELVDYRKRMLDLVEAIFNLPPTPQIDWGRLPDFGHMWSDLYRLHFHGRNDWESSRHRLSEGQKLELRQHYAATATVEAELYLRGLAGVTADWGYKTLNLICSGRPGVEVFLSSMYAWLAIAGKKMKQDAETDTVRRYGKQCNVEATIAEHWEVWKALFHMASEDKESLSPDARQIAAECHRMMQEL